MYLTTEVQQIKALIRGFTPPRVYARVRTRRIRRYIRHFAETTITHDYAGFRLTLHLHDPLAQGWYDRDWEEPVEIAELRNGRLRRGARVLDVGAHQGVVALILARIVGDAGSVIAIEAEAHNARIARQNAETNSADNMTVIHAAASAKTGTLAFAESLNGYVSTRARDGAIEVPAVAIDDVVAREGHPDVVLIDVEGYEAHVLEGASKLIAARCSDFCIEVHNAATLRSVGSTARDVVHHFMGGRYELLVALTDDTPPGLGSSELATEWTRITSAAEIDALGRRFFLVARPRSRT
ncbi:MAG: FkbM family methyltransferase [Solirubrobacteraceae bacterium]